MKDNDAQAAVKAQVTPTLGADSGPVQPANEADAKAKAPPPQKKAGGAANAGKSKVAPADMPSGAPNKAANVSANTNNAADAKAKPRIKKSKVKTVEAPDDFVPGPMTPAVQKYNDALQDLDNVRTAFGRARWQATRLARAARRRETKAAMPGASTDALKEANAVRAQADAAADAAAEIQPLIRVARSACQAAKAEAEAEILADPAYEGRERVWFHRDANYPPGYVYKGMKSLAATIEALTKLEQDQSRAESASTAGADATRPKAEPVEPAAPKPWADPSSPAPKPPKPKGGEPKDHPQVDHAPAHGPADDSAIAPKPTTLKPGVKLFDKGPGVPEETSAAGTDPDEASDDGREAREREIFLVTMEATAHLAEVLKRRVDEASHPEANEPNFHPEIEEEMEAMRLYMKQLQGNIGYFQALKKLAGERLKDLRELRDWVRSISR